VGTQIAFLRNGAGTVTFRRQARGATVNSKDAAIGECKGQYCKCGRVKNSANSYLATNRKLGIGGRYEFIIELWDTG
jgi:hypothetical protein